MKQDWGDGLDDLMNFCYENRASCAWIGGYLVFMLVTAFIGLRGEGGAVDWSGGTGFVGWFRELHFVGLLLGGLIGIALCVIATSGKKRAD